MFRKLTFTLGVAVAALALISGSYAQGGGRGQGQGRQFGGGMMGGGGQSLSQLLGRRDVQDELKVTAEQKTKIEQANQKAREEMQGRMEEMRGGGDPQAMRDAMQKFQKDQDAKVLAILDKEQQARLKEISIQLRGNRALLDADVQKELGLSPEQKQKIKRLQEQQQEQMQNMMEEMRGGGGDREGMREKMQQMQTKMTEDLGKILTPDQAEKFKQRGDKPFKATEQPRRGGGGGG